jgi:hypothetical protein
MTKSFTDKFEISPKTFFFRIKQKIKAILLSFNRFKTTRLKRYMRKGDKIINSEEKN